MPRSGRDGDRAAVNSLARLGRCLNLATAIEVAQGINENYNDPSLLFDIRPEQR